MAKKGSFSTTNMIYGLGAAIVIIGALFKIQHWPYGSEILTLGMVVEALVFVYSAFEKQQDDYDWSLVYPELEGGATSAFENTKTALVEEPTGLLSKKLDEMLKEARIDSNLMTSLNASIRNFEGAARNIAPTAEAMDAQKKYSEEMALAATQLESLNGLYKVQVESVGRQAEINSQVADNAELLKDQMESLATNLSSLNKVYGGMLSAMSK